MGEKVAVFDMDGVLVQGVSSWATVHQSLGTDNEKGYLAYKSGRIDDHEFMASDIALWTERGIETVDEIEHIVENIPLMKGAETVVSFLKEHGYITVIISGGLDLLADRLAGELLMDHSVANGLETTGNGRLTGRGILRVPLLNKGAPLKVVLGRIGEIDRVIAIGDSPVDIPMFDMSDLSIAFNPREKAVSEGAMRTVFSDDLTDVLEFIRPFDEVRPDRRQT